MQITRSDPGSRPCLGGWEGVRYMQMLLQCCKCAGCLLMLHCSCMWLFLWRSRINPLNIQQAICHIDNCCSLRCKFLRPGGTRLSLEGRQGDVSSLRYLRHKCFRCILLHCSSTENCNNPLDIQDNSPKHWLQIPPARRGTNVSNNDVLLWCNGAACSTMLQYVTIW